MDSTVKFRVGLRLLAQIGLLEDVGERDGQRQFHLWPVKSRIDMQTPMRASKPDENTIGPSRTT